MAARTIIDIREAKRLKLSRYFTGRPCPKGHLSERNVVRSDCMACKRISHAKNYQENKELIKTKVQIHYRKNTEDKKQYAKDYASRNMDKTNYRQRQHYKNNTANMKTKVACRKMLKRVLDKTGTDKEGRTQKQLGFSAAELTRHLESLFTYGMSWENYGEWHIDHIIPISIYLEYGIDDPKIINALSNLQPLWAFENMAKSNRYVG